jgi:DNA-binding PadR family transcriptional regulator
VLKYLLLGLLVSGSRHGYELKNVFDDTYGDAWPLNIAQIYNALSKLEEDGMVACEVVPQENVPNRKVYSLTETGRKELERWTDTPVDGPVRLRDELYFRVLVGMETGGSQALDLIARQRLVHLEALNDLARARTGMSSKGAAPLLLEAAALRLESDLQWLDRCEDQLRSEVR